MKVQEIIPPPSRNGTNLTDEEYNILIRTYSHQLDMDRIEEFYREIVSAQNALYEGRWQTPKSVGYELNGLLQKVYGLVSSDEEVPRSITDGKSRVFLRRFSDEGLGLDNYLGLVSTDDTDAVDGPPPLIEPSHIENVNQITDKGHQNVLAIEAILFDGEHRNHEINLQMMINKKLGQNLTYSERTDIPVDPTDEPIQVSVDGDDSVFKSRHRIIRSLRVENVTMDVF